MSVRHFKKTMSTRHFFLLCFLIVSTVLNAQKGTLRGSVSDRETNETLIGAFVTVEGTTTGTVTDLDGNFSLDLPAGTYAINVSYVSYAPTIIENVVIKSGEVNTLEQVLLSQKGADLKEIVISAEAIRTSELSLMNMKKNSDALLDGISSAQFKKVGDATAVEAAKRVTGVSVEDGKYVYVRGLGDRYTKTTLNQTEIPGLDPDRNSLQMDIFPTNLIDNIVVAKNFTADQPADFTGGLLNVETKSFPEKKIFNVGISTAYNPSMHFNNNFLTYDGGKTDFLGFDDGTRALPAGASRREIPTPIGSATDQEVRDFVTSFNPQLGAKKATSLADYNASISFGNQLDLSRDNAAPRKLGYLFSASYKNEYRFYDDVQYGEYQRKIDSTNYEMTYATTQSGQLGERNVLIGLLGGLAYKTQYTKYRVTAMHLQNGESRAAQFRIENNGEAVGQSGYIAASDNLEYNQRALTNVLLSGTHVLQEKKWDIDWRISGTRSSNSDPDIRRTAFTLESTDTLFSAGAGGNPARIWRSLEEFNTHARLDLTKTYAFGEQEGKLKFGASQVLKQRNYEILFFDIQFFGSQNWPNPSPNEVLKPENIFPSENNNIYYQSGNNTPNPNAYSSNVSNTAGYISNDLRLNKRWRTIVGVRAENYVQRHTGRDQRWASGDTINGNNLDNEKVLDALDFFPSLNVIYSANERQNIRGSYTKTIARPSFKELSYAQILDPITNRIFNGSLFTYGNWDGNLVETRINNLDLRWESFGEEGQMFSVSAFYKQFEKPIEMVRIPEQQTSTEFQPRNVGDGQLIGLELEARKNLSFISPALNKLLFNVNVTMVQSQIEMTELEFNSRKQYEKVGQTVENTREMAGQSPYVINAGFTYTNDSLGVDAGLFYNVKGPTLYIVGAGLFPDIYFESFHSLNFSVSKKFGEENRSAVDFRISNLLNDAWEYNYQSYKATPQTFSRMSPGRAFSIGFSHKF
jgi:TonB-dependent receptor